MFTAVNAIPSAYVCPSRKSCISIQELPAADRLQPARMKRYNEPRKEPSHRKGKKGTFKIFATLPRSVLIPPQRQLLDKGRSVELSPSLMLPSTRVGTRRRTIRKKCRKVGCQASHAMARFFQVTQRALIGVPWFWPTTACHRLHPALWVASGADDVYLSAHSASSVTI